MHNTDTTQIYDIETNSQPLEVHFYRYIGNSDNNSMGWAKRLLDSNRAYSRAGKLLIDKNIPDSDKDEVYNHVNNWRAIHAFPLNTAQTTLRKKAKQIDLEATVAQRTKRLSSIIRKLEKSSTMELAQIQDIGGCRAILKDTKSVNELAWWYRFKSGYAIKENDYITTPKQDGYRSIHFVYPYKGKTKTEYDGLKIEVQIRSRAQHAWATAVETVDVFTNQSLKFGGGEADWKRFFALMSSYMAHCEEASPVPGTPNNLPEVVKEIEYYESKLSVTKTLEGYARTVNLDDLKINDGYLIIELYPHRHIVDLIYYEKGHYEEAVERYIRDERMMAHANINIVLVSVESIKALRLAYPNYFGDTRLFLGYLDSAKRSHVTNTFNKINL